MRTIEAADRHSYRRMTTDELRKDFVVENLFQPGKLELVYTNADRAVVGGIVPAAEPLELPPGVCSSLRGLRVGAGVR